jgi:DNA primase
MIDRATVDKILDAAQIVDVVGEFVTLRKSGVNYKGLCPFHDDRNPSFMVSPAKNICHCFVCGKGGSPAGFLMEHEQITYPEALRWLAKKYNIEIVEKELTDEERAQQNERESLFIVNEWAKDWFHNVLKNDPDGIAIGKQYFRSRGIRDDIIEKFQLGYAPQQRDALATAGRKAGYKPEFLLKTGLCVDRGEKAEAKGEKLADRYSGRVIFPWLNVSGKVVAFGGRVLDTRTKGVAQKYVNSPDSDIYHKERELYGIYQAKKTIVKEDRVFMVEGYTDVIAMHQAGVENVVANSGTALSVHQIRMLHRFTQNITLLYDGDEAGIHAAMRGTDMLLAEGMNIKVLLLPDGDDPDSFARKHSSEELKKYILDHQQDFIEFKTRLTVEGVTDPVKRSEAISGIVKSISVIPNPILRSTYLSDFAMKMHLKEQTLLSTMNKFIRQEIEEKQKEKERAQTRSQSTNVEGNGAEAPAPDTPVTQSNYSPPSQGKATGMRDSGNEAGGESLGGGSTVIGSPSPVETLLLREVVRHGEEVIYDNVETEDGQTLSFTVAQYIDYDLSADGILFSNPLYNQILAEAVAHSGEEGFRAEQYFTAHPDITISQLATRLVVDRHQLGGRFVMQPREGSLRQRVVHLVMDYRMDLMSQRLKEIQQSMREAMGDMDHVMKLMQEYKETQELRDMLAKRLGSDVVT